MGTGLLGLALLRVAMPLPGAALLLLACAALVWAGGAPPSLSRPFSLRLELALLSAIVAIGAWLRFRGLADLPPGCWFDEAENGLETLRVLSGDLFVFTPNNNGRGALQFLATAPLFKLFGPDLVVLRATSALAGTATIPAAWFLYRNLAGPRAALLAAALLAGSGWHLTVSRIGFDVAFTPLFDALAVGALVRSMRTGRLLGFAAAGALAGVALYGYYASRLTPVLLVAVGAIYFVRGSRSAPSPTPPAPRGWRGPVLTAVTFLAVAAPLASYVARHPDAYFARSRQIGIQRQIAETGSYRPMVENAQRTLRMFHDRGDWNPRHNLPGRPMLDPVTGLAFLAGLHLAWGRRRDPAVAASVTWLALVLVAGGVLTTAAPHANRTVSGLLPVCLLSAWGMESLTLRLLPTVRSAAVTAAVLVATAGAINAKGYFVDYARTPSLDQKFYGPSYRAGLLLRELPPKRRAIVSGELSESVIRFVSRREPASLEFTSLSSLAPAADPGTVYLLGKRENVPASFAPDRFTVREFPGPDGGGFVLVERTSGAP